jgi:peptide/nickel transport system ATP-binding protein
MFGKKAHQEPKKENAYISRKESQRITKYNKKRVRELDQKRKEYRANPDSWKAVLKDKHNIVEFDQLCTYFFTDIGTVKAVDGISFDIPEKSTVGIVGESGCGKSVTSLSLMQLLQKPHGQTVDGQIRFRVQNTETDASRNADTKAQTKENYDAYDMTKTPEEVLNTIRGNRISMIFQEPMTSLNPVFRIGNQLDEVLVLHFPHMSVADRKNRALELMELVGIANKEGVYQMYPHELSGGMRQRIMIAMALACDPELIIADEPTTALDVTIQAQILELLKDLKEKLNTSIMLITHDLGVVANMADYVVVMYAGRVVEKGTVQEVFLNPAHPYTIGLMKSKPVVGRKVESLYNIPGNVPNPINMPNYCYFKDRCEYCVAECDGAYPETIQLSDTHWVSCRRKLEP